MKAYELLFIVAPTIDDETRAGVMKRIETDDRRRPGRGGQRRQLGQA